MTLEWWHYLLFGLPALINLWAIWHALVRSTIPFIQQVIWAGICVFVPVLGGLLYFFIVFLRQPKKT